MILLTQIRHTIYEALDSAVPFTVSDYKPGEIWEAEAKISESYTLQVTAYTDQYVGMDTRNVWQVEFKPIGQSVDKLGIDHGKKYGIVGTGGDAATIMATVIGMMDEFIVIAAPPQIRFTASEPSRLHDRLWAKFAPRLKSLGYTCLRSGGSKVTYWAGTETLGEDGDY